MEVVAMMSVKDMITRIRAQTHDHQMTGFQDWEIIMYINDGLRFLRRIIMDLYPSMLIDIDMEGELGDGENAIYTYQPISSLIDVRIDGEHIDIINPRDIGKLNKTGKPKYYYLSGTNCIKVWPVCDKPYSYSIMAIGDFEPMDINSETPVPNEFDDFVQEYAIIRMSVTNEFDISQENSIMSNIIQQVTSRLQSFTEPGVRVKSYW
jgi:hypothetical protein